MAVFMVIFLFTGGGLSVAYDKDGLDRYDDVVSEAKTTKGIRRILRRSTIVRDGSNKCLLEIEFTSNGNRAYHKPYNQKPQLQKLVASLYCTIGDYINF